MTLSIIARFINENIEDVLFRKRFSAIYDVYTATTRKKCANFHEGKTCRQIFVIVQMYILIH